MSKVKVLTSVLVAVACVAVLAPSARAGGATGQSLPDGTTACRAIVNPGNPPYIVELLDSTLNETARVAPVAILCELPPPDPSTVGVATTVVKGPTLTPVTSANVVVCYQVAGPMKNQTTPVTITTSLGTITSPLSGFQWLCVPGQAQ